MKEKSIDAEELRLALMHLRIARTLLKEHRRVPRAVYERADALTLDAEELLEQMRHFTKKGPGEDE